MTIYLLLAVVLIIAGLGFKTCNKALDIMYQKNKIESDRLIKDTVIDDSAIKQLDIMIDEILKEYIILNLQAKDISYINNEVENQIREYVVEEVVKRIPVLLMKKLEYVCNADYIGELIGKRVYMAVTNYTLEFNVSDNKKNR